MFMKKSIITTVAIALMASGMATAGGITLKNIKGVKIKRNLSMASIKKSMQRQKEKMKKYGITVVVDPKFDCESIGFSKKDLFASGTMYGTTLKNGDISISGKGEFKAYSYRRYVKGNKECTDTTYTKKYDPEVYGRHSIAMVFK